MLAYKPHVFLAQNSDGSFDLHIIVSLAEDQTLKRHTPEISGPVRTLRYELVPYSYEPDVPPMMYQTVETIHLSGIEEKSVVVEVIEWSSQAEGYQILGEIALQYSEKAMRAVGQHTGKHADPDDDEPDNPLDDVT